MLPTVKMEVAVMAVELYFERTRNVHVSKFQEFNKLIFKQCLYVHMYVYIFTFDSRICVSTLQPK